MNLAPGTSYDISLTLDGSDLRTECRGTTWSETFPVKSTVKVSDRDTTLTLDESGGPGAYVLYDGSGCTLDTGNEDDIGIAVRASYVILRGFAIKNVKEHGIRLFSGHHIVIEVCDISKWGSESEKGWGKNSQACVFSNSRDLNSVVIQRCKMHHPSWDSNSWAEKHGKSNHPAGPQTVVFWESEGNHVIRYNECWSDEDHYFNILHVRDGDCCSVAVGRSQVDNDFDHDLTSAGFPDNHEKQGLKGLPQYVQGAGFDPGTRTGMFQLAPGSKGVDAAVVIPNFCEAINGNRPDLGAHESGTGKMQFGVRAQLNAFDTPETTQKETAN